MWLWPPLMQKELDKFCQFANNCRMRKQPDKLLPSEVSPKFAYLFPERFDAHDCLQTVDVQIVEEILNDLEEEKRMLTDWGVPEEFSERAKEVLQMIEVGEVTLSNIWIVFNAMLHYL